MKTYSKDLKALVFFKEQATPGFWDKHWGGDDYYQHLIRYKNLRFIRHYTQKYLPKGARVLEGGCGQCEKVYTLCNNSYQAYGVDFAQETLRSVKNAMPELKLIIGNVESLMFKDMTFDGYWSLGVIEHFYDGYDKIALEMGRILKPGGYLFLTFPQMSCLRKIKAHLNLYLQFNRDKVDKERFYQFALDRKLVIEKFRRLGFKEVRISATDGLKGLKDEVSLLKPPLQKLYDYKGKSIIIRGTRYLLDKILAPLTGHSAFVIFKKDRNLDS